MASPYTRLSPFGQEENQLNILIDTPKGSRNKFAFDEELLLFKLKKILPEGSSFPFDFGFIPNTLAEDGDPLDVLLLMDEPAFTGCLVEARAIGIIKAEQTEKDGKTVRNDRLLAVASTSITHQEIRTLQHLPKPFLQQIEHFFKSYNEGLGRKFKVIENGGPTQAMELVEKAIIKYKKHRKTA